MIFFKLKEYLGVIDILAFAVLFSFFRTKHVDFSLIKDKNWLAAHTFVAILKT